MNPEKKDFDTNKREYRNAALVGAAFGLVVIGIAFALQKRIESGFGPDPRLGYDIELISAGDKLILGYPWAVVLIGAGLAVVITCLRKISQEK